MDHSLSHFYFRLSIFPSWLAGNVSYARSNRKSADHSRRDDGLTRYLRDSIVFPEKIGNIVDLDCVRLLERIFLARIVALDKTN